MASLTRAGKTLISQVARQSLTRTTASTNILPAILIKRNDSIFTKYREPPNGFLFNEKPRKPGEKREWEDWEAIWYLGWGVAFAITVVGLYYKPEPKYLKEAKAEAIRRMAEIDAQEAALQASEETDDD
eukprot:gene6015-6713_t